MRADSTHRVHEVFDVRPVGRLLIGADLRGECYLVAQSVTRNTSHLLVVFVLLIQNPLRDLRSNQLQPLVAVRIPVSNLFLEAAPGNLQVPDGNQSIGNVLKEPHDCHRSVVDRLIRQLGSRVIVIFDLHDLDVLVMTLTELTLHLRNPSGEISQYTFDVADVDLLLLEVLLQLRDLLLVSTSELFSSTLPLEIIIQELTMTVRPPIQGLRVCVDPINKRVPHLLLERSPLPLQFVVL